MNVGTFSSTRVGESFLSSLESPRQEELVYPKEQRYPPVEINVVENGRPLAMCESGKDATGARCGPMGRSGRSN